jgi:hypothetical protein
MTRVPFVVFIAMVWFQSALAQNGAGAIDEVVVIGRMPGPPLWKVSSGDHVLWIFPHILIVPKEMRWESGGVERLIAGAQEYLPMPVAISALAIGPNPIKVARAFALYRESIRLPDGQTLADVLPPALYERFGILKARYLPRNDGIEELVPQEAAKRLANAGFDAENLGPPTLITSTLDRFVRRNDMIRVTDVSVREIETVKINELRQVVEAGSGASLSEAGIACFEQRITYFETSLPHIRRRANAWAQGFVDELVATASRPDETDACVDWSPEVDARMREQWLSAAEGALANNPRTFAVLALDEVVLPSGLVAELEAKGYTVEISAQ